MHISVHSRLPTTGANWVSKKDKKKTTSTYIPKYRSIKTCTSRTSRSVLFCFRCFFVAKFIFICFFFRGKWCARAFRPKPNHREKKFIYVFFVFSLIRRPDENRMQFSEKYLSLSVSWLYVFRIFNFWFLALEWLHMELVFCLYVNAISHVLHFFLERYEQVCLSTQI